MSFWERKLLFFTLIMLFPTLAGCTLNRLEPTNYIATSSTETFAAAASSIASPISRAKTPTPQPLIAIPSLTPTRPAYATRAVTPLPLPPTMNPGQEHRMSEFLLANDCELPCYLGITPGKSSWEEAQIILAGLGAVSWEEANNIKDPSYDVTENGWPVYEYFLNIGESTTPTPGSDDGSGWGIYHTLAFTVMDGQVKRIQVNIATRDLKDVFWKYWARYSLDEVLHRFGLPDKVFFGITQGWDIYSVHLVYADVGVVLDYIGGRKNNLGLICPIQGISNSRVIHQNMTLTDHTSSLGIYYPFVVPLTNKDVYLPIQDALGIDETEFYNSLLANPSACFEIKATN